MIDIQLLRDNPEAVRAGAKAKKVHINVEDILALDREHRALLQKIEACRAEKRVAGKEIGKTKDTARKEELLAAMRVVDAQEEALKPEIAKVEERLHALLMNIPNMPAADVTVGKDDTENEIIRRVGEIPKFDFTPKDYLTLAAQHNLIDVERAAKVSGSRFGYIMGDAALLQFALIHYATETLIREGYTPVLPPVLVNESTMRGMGYLEHGGEDETYHFTQDDLYLVGTSEQSIVPMHRDEILEEKNMPRRYFGYSTCFRREAGAHGKDTRGILRVHQFDKVEMVSVVRPEDGDAEHERLLAIEEKLMQGLQLPYHVLKICTGDLGGPAARKYDIEAWIPSEGKYRETHSTSTCTDFQSRRLNIRFRREKGGVEFAHILNGTAFAMGRTIIAILENYQQADGSIAIPEVLQKYMGKKKIG